MAATSERKELIAGDEIYAPQIEVIVGGKNITDKVNGDVIELHVTLEEGELGGFTLQLTNHFEVPDSSDNGDAERKFRHSDDPEYQLYEQVKISMGYAGQLSRLLIGEITSIQAAFPSGGAPTLTITGTDYMNRLRQAVPDDNSTKNYSNLADWQIAQQIAQRHDLTFSKDSTKEGETRQLTSQGTDDDLKFLLRLAKRSHFECCVIIEDDEPALYFGTPRDKRKGDAVKQLKLSYGESLVSFSPHLAAGEQLSKLTVRGYNARKKDKFKYTAEASDLPKTASDGESGADVINRVFKKGREQRVVNVAVQSQQEAKQRAIEMFTESGYKFLTGSGEAIGTPELRPLVNLELAGLGKRYSGIYYVTKTEHVYGASGYTTSFDVKRLRVTKVEEEGKTP